MRYIENLTISCNKTTLQVFPRLMKIGSPKSSFPIYSLFFQEACALSLLETCIFHVDVAENLEDAGTDLLDYCVRWGLIHLILHNIIT